MKAVVLLYYNGVKRKGRKLVQYLGLGLAEGKKPTTLQA